MKELTINQLKKSLEDISQSILHVTDNLIVHKDYLGDLSNQEFLIAYKEYRDIITEFFLEASIYPMEYGYSNISRKTGEEDIQKPFVFSMNHQDKEIQVIKFMLRTIRSSTFKNNTLIIDVARLNEALNNNGKIHKPDFIVKNLIKRGFVFEGYNKSLKKSQNLIMKYPINPNVIIVIDSYAKSKYAEDNDVCGSTVFDYAHFNYKLLTIGISESLQLDDLYVYQKLSKKVQSFIKEFNSTMNENNYYYGNNASNAHNWGDSQFAYSKAPEKRTNYVCRLFQRGDNLIVRLYLHNIDRYTQYIENTPDYIKKSFIDDHGKCNGCKEKCHARKTYTIDDNKYSKCQGEMLYFKSVDLEAIPYYVDLINLSATKGKYLTEK